MNITNEDKKYIRELALRYREYAELDVMEERRRLWLDHNSLRSDRPLVIMENSTFNDDFLPPLLCRSETGRIIEKTLVEAITNHELIDDDKVISPYFPLELKIDFLPFGGAVKRSFSKDDQGREIGYANSYPIRDLKTDLSALKHSEYSVDLEGTKQIKNAALECFGDFLPVRIKNGSLNWQVMPSKHVVDLMGMEAMMFAIFDHPQELQDLFEFIKKDIRQYMSWQEEEGLLVLNNGNDYAGSGSYGFTNELPTESSDPDRIIQTCDLWGNMNSQESVGLSPDMFGEVIFPHYKELARDFGLIYFGCCEAVHDLWKDYLSTIPNLRKVSVSPWCDCQAMGEYLRGSRTIYSRKPSPNFIGVGKVLDEEAFRSDMTRSIRAARGNTMEIIFRDIYTLEGERQKPGRAVQIVRELLETLW